MTDSIALVAGVVLRNNEGLYLLVQELQAQAYGKWNLPAGHVDKGESLQEAAIREGQEETGLIIELVNYKPLEVELNHNSTKRLHSFEARILSGELDWPRDELLDARWMSLTDIHELEQEGKIRDQWVVKSVEKVEKYANIRH